MAHVRKRPGRKTPTIRFWDPALGKRREVSANSGEAKAIRAKRTEVEGKLARNEPIDAAVNKITFDDAAKLIVSDYKRQQRRSLDDGLQRTLDNHLTPYFGGMLLVRLTYDALSAYFEARQEGTTEPTQKHQVQRKAGLGTLRKELAAIRRIFKLARQAKKITADMVPAFPVIAKPKPRKGFFEPYQLEAVKEALLASLRPRERASAPVLCDMLDLYAACGWRKRNLIRLEWANVNRFEGTMSVDTGETKNGEPLSFPYVEDPQLKTIIDRRWREKEAAEKRLGRPVRWVFFRYAEAKPILSFHDALRTAARVAAASLGDPTIEQRVTHDLRRTAVRRLNQAKVPHRTIMDITGHKTMNVFLDYNITNDADKRRAVAAGAAEAAREERQRNSTPGKVLEMVVGDSSGGHSGGQS